MERASGVSAGAVVSMEEPQLPGVLPDLAGLGELILARGNFNVVTEPDGSSRMRARMDGAGSEAGKFGGRVIFRAEEECEKKRGDAGPSGCEGPAEDMLRVDLGMSLILGGDAPVRGFFTGDGSMVLSVKAGLDEARFTLLWSPLITLG